MIIQKTRVLLRLVFVRRVAFKIKQIYKSFSPLKKWDHFHYIQYMYIYKSPFITYLLYFIYITVSSRYNELQGTEFFFRYNGNPIVTK